MALVASNLYARGLTLSSITHNLRYSVYVRLKKTLLNLILILLPQVSLIISLPILDIPQSHFNHYKYAVHFHAYIIKYLG